MAVRLTPFPVAKVATVVTPVQVVPQRPVTVTVTTVVKAADLLKSEHPYHAEFTTFIGDKTPTKRQARNYLASHESKRLLHTRVLPPAIAA